MGFWLFIAIIDILIPILMIVLGKSFQHNIPSNINFLFGYRTSMSMKNEDTWNFAHKYFGRIWYVTGLILLLLSLVPLLFVIGKDKQTIGIVGGIICLVQLIPLMVPIIPTEIALKKRFDKEGNFKSKA